MRLYYLSLRNEGKRVLREGLRVPKRRGKPTGISLYTCRAYHEILLARALRSNNRPVYMVIVDIPRSWCHIDEDRWVICMRDIPVERVEHVGLAWGW